MRKGIRPRFWAVGAGLLLTGMTFAGLSACLLNAPYDKYAIVYGVADYEGTANDLQYPDDDALAMAAMLTDQGYQVIQRLDAAATRGNLETVDVPAVAAAAKEDDLFVFYFSGHGGFGGSGPEPAGSDPVTEWIFLCGSLSDSSQTFSDDQLLAAFSPIRARKKVIILDSCNSGGFIGNGLEADGIPQSLYEPGDSLGERISRALNLYANFDGSSADIPPWEAIVLSASGELESSYESPPLIPQYYHGVFTYYLLQADSQGDGNGDGYVTVTEAFDYARRMINRDWNRVNGIYGAAFSPHVSGGPVDYVLFEAR